MSEITDIHEPLMRWLNTEGLPYIRSRSDRQSTTTPGDPDFVILAHGSALCLELKTEKGSLSAAQKRRHAYFARAGIVVHVCRDVGAAVEIVRAWRGSLRRIEPTPSQTRQRLTIRDVPGHGSHVFDGADKLRRATIDDLKLYPSE